MGQAVNLSDTKAAPHGPTEYSFPLERRIGKKSANVLEKHLGLRTVGELLDYYPRAYMKRGELTPIADVPRDEDVTLVARIHTNTQRRMQTRKGSITEITITDGSGGLGYMHVTFFNGYAAHKELTVGMQAMFSGKVTSYKGQLTLTNPVYTLLADDDGTESETLATRPIPVYPATGKLTSWKIKDAVGILLDSVNFEALPDPVPYEMARREGLLSLREAYEQLHRPDTMEEIAEAERRIRFQEAVVLQTALAKRRAEHARQDATARPAQSGGLLDRFDARLPFTLTDGQREIGEDLSGELARDHPMNRLLQGEVGSGKTIVALRAMLQVIDAGGQAAMLAPTEVLAAQHYYSITAALGPLAEAGMLGGDVDGTQVRLLTGSQSTAERKRAMLAAADGSAGIVIGTHALLSENVSFFDLGLIVVDEQHRFGVEQRDVLRTKALKPPHLLVMTATPIPRTVAMTVFGDLDTSSLTELPAGRSPISTHVVPLAENPNWKDRIWARAREEIDVGRQVYLVCPKIGDDDVSAGRDVPDLVNDDDDGLAGGDGVGDRSRSGANDVGRGGNGTSKPKGPPLAAVIKLARLTAEVPALAGTRIGILHGRLDAEEKSATMAAFNAGEIDMLISTTVIEVGVDVPNATLMIILDADRFGISQLHQLRGRVGRGGHAGTCLLVTNLEKGHPSRTRLDATAATTDGFELAQLDLQLRREGDVLGSSQSGGKSTLKKLRVVHSGDQAIIEKSRAEAQTIIDADPDLKQHQDLARAIEQYLKPEEEAFLERG
ncbi:ATP-dependent DNA helicase RecG [Arthrobacter sp. H14]|uniref:ATP-dependent DNA helicase RecG n=1 Tax=Arthrobacter sp. H14 TaxID=1312959 RepID=UPI0004B00EA8